MKKDIRKTFEKTFAAVAFAEAGEHETAMKMAGITATAKTVFDKLIAFVDKYMSAASYAEEGCFEEAKEILGTQQKPNSCGRRDSLEDFLNCVGLGKANVRFGLATVDI